MQTKIIEGKNINDELRIFTFKLLNAEQGLKLFHELVPVIADLIPIARGGLQQFKEGEFSVDLIGIVKHLPSMFPWEKILEMSKLLLSGSSVKIRDNTHSVGDSGIGDYTQGDPIEVYIALFYSLVANFPKYLDPLLSAAVDSDTAQEKQEITKH